MMKLESLMCANCATATTIDAITCKPVSAVVLCPRHASVDALERERDALEKCADAAKQLHDAAEEEATSLRAQRDGLVAALESIVTIWHVLDKPEDETVDEFHSHNDLCLEACAALKRVEDAG